MRAQTTLLVVCLVFMASSTTASQKYPRLYEISTRPWLYELSQKYDTPITTLSQIPQQELVSLKDAGMEMIWFMGVWELGQYGLDLDRQEDYSSVLPDCTEEDVIGSPYAVVDYVTNPELGSDADLADLRAKLSDLGLKLMLDFVPNHLAVDSVLAASNPELFIRAPPGTEPPYDPSRYLESGIAYGRDPYSGAWTDTAQLNYWEPKTREAMATYLHKVATYADAIRCDMAMLVVNDIFYSTWELELNAWEIERPATEFWTETIAQVKEKWPDVQFLAEVYWDMEPVMVEQGFDFAYDKGLYDRLISGNLDDVRGYISGNPREVLEHLAHFTENHDEPRAVADFGGVERANAAAAISLTLPGLPFNNHGQWTGRAWKLDVHLRRSYAEEENPVATDFYARLLPIVANDVFHGGDWSWAPSEDSNDAWRLLAWRWTSDQAKRLVVVNYSDGIGSGRMKLPDVSSPTVVDLMSGESYERDVEEMKDPGLLVVLDPWAVQIFAYE